MACLAAGVTLLLGWFSATAFPRSTDDQVKVIISEVAWQGTAAGRSHEWIELYNASSIPIPLNGWSLTDGGDISITLVGTIPSEGFYVLERTEESIIDIDANQIFLGTLSDSGESLVLQDNTHSIVDSANENGGSWPAGTGPPDFRSMERTSPNGGSGDFNWHSNDTITRNGLNLYSEPINGTPGQPNSSWVSGTLEADLSLRKTAPVTATAGGPLSFTIIISNVGHASASDVKLIDILPPGFVYSGNNGHFPLQQPEPGTLIWQLGFIPPGDQITLQLTTTINFGLNGLFDNHAQVSTSISESQIANNHAQAGTLVVPTSQAVVLIKAVHFSGYELQQPDEAIQLMNVGGSTANLSGWRLQDNLGQATFPEGAVLAPANQIWIARKANSFSRQFGFEPDYEIEESILTVPNMSGGGWHLSDDGDLVLLYDSSEFLQDVLVYLSGDTTQSGWSGPAVMPYALTGVFGADGQVLFRRNDQVWGWPIADTNTAADWAQSNTGTYHNKLVQYPGWDLDAFFFSPVISETTDLLVGIAPDNAFDLMIQEIRNAEISLEIESQTIRSWPIASELISAAHRGVSVTLLLEGDPPGGIDDQEKYACRQLNAAGGACWFMISNSALHIFDRYRYLHAKIMIIDRQRVIISTENLSPDSLPNDDKSDGTWGRRGLVLVMNSPGVVSRVLAIWQADFDPSHHADLLMWQQDDPKYGDPPPGTIPITETGGSGYIVRYPTPWILTGTFESQVIQSPENSLRDQDGILHLLNEAGQGDTILVQQLNERPHWGPANSNSIDDPNPRLKAIVAAARRGASARILLDSYFSEISDPLGNHMTCREINQIAADEQLDLHCTEANPTGLGIHNKMILIEIDGRGYSFIGSINGTELSHKGNREIALIVQSDELYQLLAQMFNSDWPHIVYLPSMLYRFSGPADYMLISEIYYDPPGSTEDDEFIELVNPTNRPIRLDDFSLGDASKPEDFEDVRRFPSNTIVEPNTTLIIASTAVGFNGRFGFNPNFEIVESDPSVPNLIDDPSWGDSAAILRLGNSGDEVYLRGPGGMIVDAIAYGTGKVTRQTSCPLLTSSGRSLERYPYWADTDDCPADFRDWPFPNPGELP